MSRMLVGGVLTLFASVAVGHATVKEEGELKDGRAYVVVQPGTGPCPEGFMRSYREIIPGEIVPGEEEQAPAMLGAIVDSWNGGCIAKPKA